jgi:hypothetical protein
VTNDKTPSTPSPGRGGSRGRLGREDPSGDEGHTTEGAESWVDGRQHDRTTTVRPTASPSPEVLRHQALTRDIMRSNYLGGTTMRIRLSAAAALAAVALFAVACVPSPEPPTTTTTTTTAPDPWEAAIGQCWAPVSPTGLDLKLTGPKNTLQNGQYYVSSDGTCTSAPGFSPTIVQADDIAAAAEVCSSLQASSTLRPVRLTEFWIGSTIPADAWDC